MEAKDTVIEGTDIRMWVVGTLMSRRYGTVEKLSTDVSEKLREQAEISFKAGTEEAFTRYKESPEYKLDLMKAKSAGIKEVVESLRDLWTDGAITFLDSGPFRGKKLWAVPYELFQSKLKEWGVKMESRYSDSTPVQCTACGWEGQVMDCIHTFELVSYGEDVHAMDLCPACRCDSLKEIEEEECS